jgi:excisionase family DNA binding protein
MAVEATMNGIEGNGLKEAPSGAARPGSVRPSRRPGTAVAQVRGVLAERVVVSTTLDPFLSLRALATYAGLSVRTLREYLDHPTRPLPHYRVGGKILVRRSEFDAWIVAHRRVGVADVAGIVKDVLRSVAGS